MSATKDERAVIVISDLTELPPEKDKLYTFIERAGRAVCETLLKSNYADYVTLYDASATKANLVQTLQTIGAKPTIKAIDLIVMLHGSTNRLGFKGGSYKTDILATDIAALNLRGKLRLVYSTACFGSSHNDDFRNAGFNTSIGARKVNTNAAAELPAILQLWVSGQKIKDSLAVAENPFTRDAADAAAKLFADFNNLSYKNNIDSDKVLAGSGQLTINSNG